MNKEKKKLIEILKEYSCWTPEEYYGCIPKLADRILELFEQRDEEILEEFKKLNQLK